MDGCDAVQDAEAEEEEGEGEDERRGGGGVAEQRSLSS